MTREVLFTIASATLRKARNMSKITELTTLASASSDDIFPVVNDPAGTPATQKITLEESGTTLTRDDPDYNISGHFAEGIGGGVQRGIVASQESITNWQLHT